MALDQQSSVPGALDFSTLSMSCETAGEPQSVVVPGEFEPDVEGGDARVAAPQPLADGFVARPDGVIARTDRLLATEQMAHLDVLANDEALGAGRTIDPTSLSFSSTDDLVEVEVDDGHLMFTAGPVSYSEFPFGGYEGVEMIDRDRFPVLAGLAFNPFVRVEASYRICDDDNPANCADGLAEVTMPLEPGDPCDDPNLQFECGPYEPEVDTTCSDDMSICEVPGCTWSDDAGRYVCVYPGTLPHDPTDPGPGHDSPSSRDEPPDGNGPGDGYPSPPGTPLTPAFTG